MNKEIVREFEKSNNIPDIFEVVKKSVWKTIRKSRAGLELGLTELGNQPKGFLGAFYIGGSNIIVMNETPLRRIQETNPKLLNSYIFTILLHEYLHSLGYFDEIEVRKLTFRICSDVFGKHNLITQMAADITQFFPNLIYPEGAPQIPYKVRLIKDFDKSSISYIG